MEREQQKQPTAPDAKPAPVVQPIQSQQQKSHMPEDQGNKKESPMSGNPTPLKVENAPACGEHTNESAV